jgi:hypothetical protein
MTAGTSQASAAAVDLDACPLLSEGYHGGCVNELQTELHDPNLVVDGIFGSATKASVIAFQQAHGLKPIDGVVGPATKAALRDANSVRTPTAGSAQSTCTPGTSRFVTGETKVVPLTASREWVAGPATLKFGTTKGESATSQLTSKVSASYGIDGLSVGVEASSSNSFTLSITRSQEASFPVDAGTRAKVVYEALVKITYEGTMTTAADCTHNQTYETAKVAVDQTGFEVTRQDVATGKTQSTPPWGDTVTFAGSY